MCLLLLVALLSGIQCSQIELFFITERREAKENVANLFANSDRGLLKLASQNRKLKKIITLSEFIIRHQTNHSRGLSGSPPTIRRRRRECRGGGWMSTGGMIGMLARPWARATVWVLVNKVICQNKADPLYGVMWLEQGEEECMGTEIIVGDNLLMN